MKKDNTIKKALKEAVSYHAKLVIHTYASLESSLIAVANTQDKELTEEVLNQVVTLFADEFGLTGEIGEKNEDVLEEKVRVVKALTRLFLECIVDPSVLAEFEDQLDQLAELQRQTDEKCVH